MQGQPMSVKVTNVIKAHYAELPVIDLNYRYLVQVIEPIGMIPTEMKFPFSSAIDPLSLMRDHLLDDWHKHLKNSKKKLRKAKIDWMLTVDRVELIECDLLVPKKN
jgi:hypothetical protein